MVYATSRPVVVTAIRQSSFEPLFVLNESILEMNFGKFAARFACSSFIDPESSTTKTMSIF